MSECEVEDDNFSVETLHKNIGPRSIKNYRSMGRNNKSENIIKSSGMI